MLGREAEGGAGQARGFIIEFRSDAAGAGCDIHCQGLTNSMLDPDPGRGAAELLWASAGADVALASDMIAPAMIPTSAAFQDAWLDTPECLRVPLSGVQWRAMALRADGGLTAQIGRIISALSGRGWGRVWERDRGSAGSGHLVPAAEFRQQASVVPWESSTLAVQFCTRMCCPTAVVKL